MNKKDFAKLCFNYNKEPNEDLFELWEDNLRCYDEDEIKKTINTIISQDKYFPTLSRVLEVVKDVVKKEDAYCDEEHKREKMVRINFKPKWFNEEITSENLDESIISDFQNFLEDFRRQQ